MPQRQANLLIPLNLVSDQALRGAGVPGYELVAVPSYGILNANFQIETELGGNSRLKTMFWVKNLADVKKPTTVDGNGSVVAVSPAPAGFTSGYYYSWVEPRSVGISLAYNF